MKHQKKIWVLAFMIAAILTFTACGLGRLPEGFQRDEVETAARSVVELSTEGTRLPSGTYVPQG